MKNRVYGRGDPQKETKEYVTSFIRKKRKEIARDKWGWVGKRETDKFKQEGSYI